MPEKYPYWENSELWDKYHEESYLRAGFKDKLTPYLPGSSLYQLCDVSESNLTKLVKDHTQDFRDGKYDRPQVSALFGGYVLKVNGQEKFFPQCCGGLADIEYWERISKGSQSYYEGHPAPQIEFSQNSLTLDFSVEEFDEPFQPPPPATRLTIDLQALRNAVEKTKAELLEFGKRLKKINQEEKLEIQNIDGLLIWENTNYK
ncbi:hypothetical protein AAE02nite_04810 [Adhaeribacter aerolatus]|uniref:Uncharacterized protein n=1 Tax=Adhaeribacter aerolatus TaxID=670289 RepID=A0A512ATA3_9BACT|nr:hypothetical protein [Adhaeribacter aerolatus]GEO02817.1 hypothetical protein AAE02nite_04810 [Adhaeribacter aerolatus]